MNLNIHPPVPCPHPAWRAHRATELANQPAVASLTCDDKYVREYCDYLLLRQADYPGFGPRTALIRHPYPGIAHELHRTKHSEVCYELEARLLSQDSYPQIASRLKVDERVIHYFE